MNEQEIIKKIDELNKVTKNCCGNCGDSEKFKDLIGNLCYKHNGEMNYCKGLQEGYKAGYEEGYEDGHEKGYEDAGDPE